MDTKCDSTDSRIASDDEASVSASGRARSCACGRFYGVPRPSLDVNGAAPRLPKIRFVATQGGFFRAILHGVNNLDWNGHYAEIDIARAATLTELVEHVQAWVQSGAFPASVTASLNLPGAVAQNEEQQGSDQRAESCSVSGVISEAEEKWFPVTPPMTAQQAARSGPSPSRIPWSVADKAFSVYVGRYGRGQSLERIAERGGWYAEELDDLYPAWRKEVSEITRLRRARRAASMRR